MTTIGEASARTGVNIETIRFYERRGIVPKPRRSTAGRREYDSELIGKLRLVRRCRDLGFSLNDAATMVRLAVDGERSCEEVEQLACDNLRTVQRKIAELEELRAALSVLVAQCGQGSDRCPALIELLSD